MSTQRFRLHRLVPVVALTLASVLLSPTVSAAAPGAPAPVRNLRPTAAEPNSSRSAARLLPVFQKDVDPWDDDLPGKKPLQSGGIVDVNPLSAPGEDTAREGLLSSTLLGSARPLVGARHGEASDEADLFSFRLTVPAVITVEAISEAALQLVLWNGDGLAIAVARSESGGAPLHLVRALAAGRYLVEVESLSGDSAFYALTLDRPGRP